VATSAGRCRYQEALQQLIEAKMKGVTIEARVVPTPSPVIDLMAALKRSLAQEPPAPEQGRQRGPLSSGQPRRLKSYPNLDNFRLSPGHKDFAAPQGLR
jgi:hypothetical protein